jgi:hypothetical protein
MACGAPEDEAPELFEPAQEEELETYFIRQPATVAEVERACRAALSCCVNAVRYGGQDPEIILRLGNTVEYSDYVVSRLGFIMRSAWLRTKLGSWAGSLLVARTCGLQPSPITRTAQ